MLVPKQSDPMFLRGSARTADDPHRPGSAEDAGIRNQRKGGQASRLGWVCQETLTTHISPVHRLARQPFPVP